MPAGTAADDQAPRLMFGGLELPVRYLLRQRQPMMLGRLELMAKDAELHTLCTAKSRALGSALFVNARRYSLVTSRHTRRFRLHPATTEFALLNPLRE